MAAISRLEGTLKSEERKIDLRKRFYKILALLLVIVIVVPVLGKGSVVRAEVTDSDVNNAKKEQEEIEKKLNEAKANLEKINASKSDLQGYIKKLDEQLETINANIYSLSIKMEEKEDQIKATEEELEKAKQDKEEQYAAMKLRIQYMYETGQTTYLEAFLASESISDLLKRTEYVKSITEYDKKMMDKLVDTMNTIQATDERLKAEYTELENLQVEQKAELAAAEYLYSQKQAELKELQAKAEEAEKLEKEMEAAREEADKKVQQLIAQKQAQEAAKNDEILKNLATKTFLGWPLPLSNRTITELFGPRIHPITGQYQSRHNGIDISAKTGTPVYAAADGTVLVSQYNWSYGYYVVLYHEGGVSTLYAHSSKLLVSVGQEVKKGDVIMLVGSTGQSTGPHLHYEVWVNGEKTNPLNYYNTEGLSYRLD